MLPPLQQSSGLFASEQLRTMLEDIEARRKEAEDKAAGKDKDDKIVGTHADPVSAAANEKINAHFFGAMKGDPDPMATLIARFASAVGLSQGHDEPGRAFAQRLSDAVAMLEYEKTDSLGKPVKISLKSLRCNRRRCHLHPQWHGNDRHRPRGGNGRAHCQGSRFDRRGAGLRRTDVSCADVNARDLA